MKSSQLPVAGEFTYHELPAGVVKSAVTTMTSPIRPCPIALSSNAFAPWLAKGSR
ncbi:hypothetical protein QP185_19745 [Sphingomonas aerolata]|uniref:hypothetical protein n=1 Tax=Sphingomonas aerolata TaxID=185951 RepID=UPI002FDF68B9